MKILVTGASGFIGRRFLEMAPRDWDVSAVWSHREDFPDFVGSIGNTGISPLRCDLANRQSVEEIAGRSGEFDALVVLAANGDPVRSEADPVADLTATTLTALNTFRSFRANKLVYFSSGAVYEGMMGAVDPSMKVDPKLPYAVSHYAAERYTDYFCGTGSFTHAVALRFFGAYGPHEPARKIYSRLIRRFAFERDASIQLKGDGRNIIDAMYVDDAVRAIQTVLAGPMSPGFEIFDLPGGNPMSIESLVRRVAGLCGIDEPMFQYEGAVAEDHAFSASMEEFQRRFGVLTLTPLEKGIAGLKCWLENRPK